MSTELAVVPTARELLPESSVLNSMYEIAKRIVNTPLVPKTLTSPEAAFAVMLKGREIGMPVMASLSGIYIINGKASLYADAMLGLVYRDHGDHAIIITETTEDRCTIVYKRQGWKTPQSHTYTLAMAIQADIPRGNPNWKLRPSNMIRARCITEVCRMAFADSIAGLYTVEEMQDAELADARERVPESARTVLVETPDERTVNAVPHAAQEEPQRQPTEGAKPKSTDPAPAEWIAGLRALAADLLAVAGEIHVIPASMTRAEVRAMKAELTTVPTALRGELAKLAADLQEATGQTHAIPADLTRAYAYALKEELVIALAESLFPPVETKPVAGDLEALALEEGAVL